MGSQTGHVRDAGIRHDELNRHMAATATARSGSQRNVLIYFDLPTKSRILGNVRKSIASDGYLILGGPETAMNLDDNFVKRQIGRTGCYQLKSAADNENAAKPMSIAVGSA